LTTATDDLGGTGYWADALPPLNNKFDVKKGENAAIWVKIKVPKTALAGDYSGKITVTAENARPVEIPVQLRSRPEGPTKKPPHPQKIGISSLFPPRCRRLIVRFFATACIPD